jgi:FixJ family two-component response regulator
MLKKRGRAIILIKHFCPVFSGGSMATFSDLMPRETEILPLVFTGRINKAIAAQISMIYTKFDMRTRVLIGVGQSNKMQKQRRANS